MKNFMMHIGLRICAEHQGVGGKADKKAGKRGWGENNIPFLSQDGVVSPSQYFVVFNGFILYHRSTPWLHL